MSLVTFEADIKAHWITAVLVAVLIFGSVYGVEGIISKHDAANDAKWASILKQTQDKTASDEAQLQGTLSQVEAQNTSLAKQIANNNAILATKQAVDLKLTAPQAAQQLGGTAPDASTVALPVVTADKILSQLAEVETLTTNLADETKIASGLETEVTQQKGVISDLQTQLTASTNSCKAEVTSLNAAARKSKLKWFAIGFITGVTLGLVR